jgi:hypothetical protein
MHRISSRGVFAAGLVAVASIIGFLLLWFWTPIEFNGSFLAGADNARHIIDDLFPYRLIQPSWLKQTDDLVIRWERTEERAREIVIIALWFGFVSTVILRNARQERTKT